MPPIFFLSKPAKSRTAHEDPWLVISVKFRRIEKHYPKLSIRKSYNLSWDYFNKIALALFFLASISLYYLSKYGAFY